jgi:hypothetical protein
VGAEPTPYELLEVAIEPHLSKINTTLHPTPPPALHCLRASCDAELSVLCPTTSAKAGSPFPPLSATAIAPYADADKGQRVHRIVEASRDKISTPFIIPPLSFYYVA